MYLKKKLSKYKFVNTVNYKERTNEILHAFASEFHVYSFPLYLLALPISPLYTCNIQNSVYSQSEVKLLL